MAKRPGRPRKTFVDDKKDMMQLVDLISSSKEEEKQVKLSRKESARRLGESTKRPPSNRELKLKEAKALAATRLHEKKKAKKQASRKEATNLKAAEPAPKAERKKVSFG